MIRHCYVIITIIVFTFFFKVKTMTLFTHWHSAKTTSALADIITNSNKKLKDQVTYLEEYNDLGNYKGDFIESLNSFQTMNRFQTTFDQEEINALSSDECKVPFIKKQYIQLKYFRKIQDIQCTNYVVLHRLIPHIEYLIKRLFFWNDYGSLTYNINIIRDFIYNNIISILYDGNYIIDKWIWILYIRLMAFSNWVELYKILNENVFDFEEMENILKRLVKQCEDNNYLSKDYVTKFRLANSENDFEYLNNVIIRSHSLNGFNLRDVDIGDVSGVRQLFLTSFWSDDKLIFKEVIGVKISWSLIKKIFYEQEDSVKLELETGDILKDPYKHIFYQQMFLNILKVNFLCYVWVHVYISYNNRNNDTLSEIIIKHTTKNIVRTLGDFDLDDNFFNYLMDIFCDVVEEEKYDYQQFDELIIHVEKEISAILTKLGGSNNDDCLAKLDDKTIAEHGDQFVFLELNSIRSFKYIRSVDKKLDPIALCDLLLFINGSKETDHIFFPN